jgi:hypothetical protein
MSAMPERKLSEWTCGSCPLTYLREGRLHCPLASHPGAPRLPSARCGVSGWKLLEVADALRRRAHRGGLPHDV